MSTLVNLPLWQWFVIAMGFYGLGFGIGVTMAWIRKIQHVA